MTKGLSRIGLPLIFGIAVGAGCSGDSLVAVEDPAPASLSVLSGNDQVGLQRTVLPQAVVATVSAEDGTPVPNVEVRGRITAGLGSLQDYTVATDEHGQAAFSWTLGDAYEQEMEMSLVTHPDISYGVRATAKYLYTVPANTDDGWLVQTVEASSAQRLFDGVDEIRKGAYPEVHSLLVVQAGELLLETYFPGHDSQGRFIEFDRNTPHEVQSASKSFRSAMIGIAIDRGFLRGADQTIAEILPEHASLMIGGKENITVHDFLTMSSGLEWNEWAYPFGDSRNNLSTMYSLPYSDWVEFVLARPLAFTPGTTFVYNTGASIMLNNLVIEASGMTLATFARTFYASLVESATLPGLGNPLGAHTLPRDMAKLGQVYLTGGLWHQTRVISQEWINESLEPRFRVDSDDEYGYQWWIRTLSTGSGTYKTQYASGNGGQFIFLVRDLNLVVVSTGGNFGSSTMFQTFDLLERYVLPVFE